MYQHCIALDCAQSNMAIANLTGESNRASARDVPASVEDLKEYLKSLRGSTMMTSLKEASGSRIKDLPFSEVLALQA